MKWVDGIGKHKLINCNWGCVHAYSIAIWAQGLDIFRLEAAAADGRMIPSGNLFFVKGSLFGWISGS
jgi:hypothetical protein